MRIHRLFGFGLVFLITLAIPALHGQETPVGTVGGSGMYQQARPLSSAIAATRIPVVWGGCGTAKVDGILSPGEWSNAASGKNVDGEVDGNRPRMKEVERPDVEGASGEVNAAWSFRSTGNFRS